MRVSIQKGLIAILEDTPDFVQDDLLVRGFAVVKSGKDLEKLKRYSLDVDIVVTRGSGVLLGKVRKAAPHAEMLIIDTKPPRVGSKKELKDVHFIQVGSGRTAKFINTVSQLLQERKSAPELSVETSSRTSLARHLREEFHNKTTGRLDAQKIAKELSIPLSQLKKLTGVSPAGLHKNPAGLGIQPALQPLAYVITMLDEVLGSRLEARKWLNAPHPDLGGQSPLTLIRDGKAADVVGLLESALAGQVS
jgi:uncharacterized protein (DUF2384 family)